MIFDFRRCEAEVREMLMFVQRFIQCSTHITKPVIRPVIADRGFCTAGKLLSTILSHFPFLSNWLQETQRS